MPIEPPLPDGPILVVSPHLHDAALSCAALIDRPEPVTVLDICTLAPEPDRADDWDRRCGFEGAQEATAARELEEEAAFAGTRHEVLAVDLLDGRYISGTGISGTRTVGDERRLRAAVGDWCARSTSSTVILPAGAGSPTGPGLPLSTRMRAGLSGRRALTVDPDHLWVRDHVLAVMRYRPEVEVWLYEELPQRFSRRADAAVGLVAEWAGRRAEPVDVPIDRDRKASRLAAYASQMPHLLGTADVSGLARRLPKDERYWVLAPLATHPADGSGTDGEVIAAMVVDALDVER